MTGPYRNPRRATIFVIFFVHVILQRIEGYPYEWRDFFSSGNLNEPFGGEVSFVGSPATSVATDYNNRESAVSGESIRYRESRVSSDDDIGESRVDDRSQEKWIEDLGDDDGNKNVNERVGNTENYGTQDTEVDARTQDTEDEITRLIKQALKDNVFLSPQKWAETLADKPFNIPEDEDMSVKVQKPRSPSDPPKKPSQTTNSNVNDQIFFPDNVPKRTVESRTGSVPMCEGSTFCVDPPFYPSDSEIEEDLNKHFIEPVSEPPSISERIGPMDEENGLCLSRDQIILPKSGIDDNEVWRVIYNKEDYVQSVKVEVCMKPDKPCEIIQGIAGGYTSTCKQKYIYRHLVGRGPNGTAALLPIRLPSSCCCQVTLSSDPMTRLGITPKRSKRQSFPPNINEY